MEKPSIPLEMCASLTCPKCKGKGAVTVVRPESLRAFREAAGKSQGSTAHVLGISEQQLSQIERGRRSVDISFVARFKAAVKRALPDQRKAGA